MNTRFLGIDFGTKRIGLAISDEGRTLAFPKIILENKNIIPKIKEIIQQENISEIVIGESMNQKGEANSVAKDIEKFIGTLQEEFNLPIHKQKEFFTSVEARRYETKGGKIDSSAAALILQRYLDRLNNSPT